MNVKYLYFEISSANLCSTDKPVVCDCELNAILKSADIAIFVADNFDNFFDEPFKNKKK